MSGAGALVHEQIASRAAQSPDAIAISFESGRLTYRELDRRANRLAHRLVRHGVQPGDLVAVQLERCLDLVVVLVGILKAGAAYVPIDPEAPAARRDAILRASAAAILVTHAGRAAAPSIARLEIEAPDTWTDVPELAPDVDVGPDDLMYVLFTSGTTGEPKGVMIEHGGIANLLAWMVSAYAFSPRDRLLQKTPYTFDASVWELFLPLVSGGTVVVARPGGHRDPRYLVEIIAAERITTLQLVPSMLRHVLDEPGLAACHTLRHLFCGGEALSRELIDRCFAVRRIPLHNLYGPTETSVQVLTWTCRPDDPRSYVSIGVPIDNVTARVLDPAGHPVRAGEVGELCISGVAVARGYLGDPALTAQRFTRDLASGDRLYRTGDLVREHADGTFEFLGRFDDQVKIQGFRVELGEIEARLRELPGVGDAAVIAERSSERTYLVAYLEAGDVQLRELRAQLARHLPDYMIPSQFKVAARLPLSAHGKLDKAALPRLAAVTLTESAPAERSRNDLEQKLVDIWSGLLGVSSVGIRDDFFELGGDSITGLLVIARAKQHGIVLTTEDLFRLRRIDEIATAARRRSQNRI